MQQAKAEQQQQQEIVARHTLTAPFAGVIAQRTTDVGQQALLPGTSASATFYFERDDATVLVVPPDALRRHPDGNFSLFAIRDNKACRHNVTLGRSSEQGVEILSGLPKQQAVVVRGNETLRDGQAVRVLSDDKE